MWTDLADVWPTTVYQLEKVLAGKEWQVVTYDICNNECCCFFSPTETACTVCGEPRFDAHGCARRIVLYVPLRRRLLSLVANQGFVNLIEYDHQPRAGLFCDIRDGTEWSRIMAPLLATNKHCLALACCIDGVSKGKFSVKTESVWIHVTKIMSLPPAYRNKPEFQLLNFVLPGKCKNFAAYGQIYARECQDLFEDAIAGLVFLVADNPAMSMVTGTTGSAGQQGCHLVCIAECNQYIVNIITKP